MMMMMMMMMMLLLPLLLAPVLLLPVLVLLPEHPRLNLGPCHLERDRRSSRARANF